MYSMCVTFSSSVQPDPVWKSLFSTSYSFHLLHCVISPRLASKHEREDRCVASSADDISCAPSVRPSSFWLFLFLSFACPSPLYLPLSYCFYSCSPQWSDLFLPFSVIAALQTRPVYRKRAWRHTRGGGLGSLEPFWYLFSDMRRRHQDGRARMQPTRVSSPSLCSHALPSGPCLHLSCQTQCCMDQTSSREFFP